MSVTLDTYRLLGRSGLRVSPLALGTMTFGWGTDPDDARKLFDTYVEHGGNFIDTANTYADGNSEKLIGEFTRDNRENLVLATKYSLLRRPGDPNSGGNHRKSMIASVEESLRRMQTDYIDLLYLHWWDFLTPVEEILRGMDDLVRQGKVLYAGISDTPAWQVSRMQAITDLRGWSPLVALQIPYSLLERTVERDLIPMAREMGLGTVLWSPLANGVLTGKYSRADLAESSVDMFREGSNDTITRKDVALGHGHLTEHGLAVAEVVKQAAAELGKTPSQVAYAWTLHNPGVTSPIVGARTLAQLQDNLGALDVEFDPTHLARLDEASAIDLGFPHELLARDGGASVGTQMVETRPGRRPARWAATKMETTDHPGPDNS